MDMIHVQRGKVMGIAELDKGRLELVAAVFWLDCKDDEDYELKTWHDQYYEMFGPPLGVSLDFIDKVCEMNQDNAEAKLLMIEEPLPVH